jgi:adenylate cyclase
VSTTAATGVDPQYRQRLTNWLVTGGLTGVPESELVRGFCKQCRSSGLALSRGLVIIDTLHPVFEGRGFRWGDDNPAANEAFEYGSSSEGEAADSWRRSVFHHMLEHGTSELCIDLADPSSLGFSTIGDLAAKGHRHLVAFVHRFGEAGTIGQMDCLYSYWLTRDAGGFEERHLSALRDVVPVLGLAVKSAAHAHIARTVGQVYLGRDAAEQVMHGRISRGTTERIDAVLWFSDLRQSTAIAETMDPDEIIPFLNDYAEAAIVAIHQFGGDVLKLIGDGVLAVFTGGDMVAARRAALRAEHQFRKNLAVISARRSFEGRPVTSAYVGLHVGEVFYGNIGSADRLDFTVVGPAVNEVSRIASMCASVDRELLISSVFQAGLDEAGRKHLVLTGRFALRGLRHAQKLYTLDPDILNDGEAEARYRDYLA